VRLPKAVSATQPTLGFLVKWQVLVNGSGGTRFGAHPEQYLGSGRGNAPMNRARHDRNRTTLGLLPVLVLTLLPTPVCPGSSITDERVLRIQDGDGARQVSLTELIAAVGLTELRVAEDPHFGPDRVFAGFELEALLSHVGLGDAPELLLVCSDGYTIPFRRSLLSQPGLRGLLAVRDTALSADGEAHWPPFRHGAELVSFDPFYLVWASTDPSIDLGTETLPWPFQLTEIRHFDRARYFAPARPTAGTGDAVQEGFGTYMAHCGKCHRMRGAGGQVGPELDREGSLSSVLTTAQLTEYVRHEEGRFPHSKMPPYSEILTPEQIDQLVAYLQAMQPR
jgi:mono/diheme cytochrome c family protein